MTEHLMDNPRAERVKKIAALATRAGRKKQGKFLAEGPQPVREALKHWLGLWGAQQAAAEGDFGSEPGGARYLPELDALYFDPRAVEQHPDIASLLDQLRGVLFDPQAQLPRRSRVFLREATPEVLRAMGEVETSQGMIAVCRIPEEARHIDAAPSAFSARKATHLAVVLCELQDPGNLGTIIRTADAAGADAALLSTGTTDPWAPKVVRSAAGSHFHLPIMTSMDVQELIEHHRGQGIRTLAATADAELSLTDLYTESSPPLLAQSTLWMLGNEAHGLSPEQQRLADHRVRIPIYGQAESLNVSVAASICLYASAMAQRRDSR